MKFRWAAVLTGMLVFGCWSFAQHGSDEFKLGSNVPRDTWTGTVKSVEHETSTINLEYEHKGKVESFSGVLKPPLQVLDKEGKPAQPPIHIQAGDRLLVHYIKEGAKYPSNDGGKRHDEVAKQNLIVEIQFLPTKQ